MLDSFGATGHFATRSSETKALEGEGGGRVDCSPTTQSKVVLQASPPNIDRGGFMSRKMNAYCTFLKFQIGLLCRFSIPQYIDIRPSIIRHM